MDRGYKRTKYACYVTGASTAIIVVLSPLLFLTFRETYDISFGQLGAIVLVNFCVQLGIDLVFSFFSHWFNMQKTVKLMPLFTAVGLVVYGVLPPLFPSMAYVWILVGTVIFAVSGGLCEVLASPVVAAIPSENPEREMSTLHSMYAWGTLVVVAVSTGFIAVFGREHWYFLALLWAAVPFVASILFAGAKIPPLETPARISNVASFLKNRRFIFCMVCMFCAGAAECTMSQWSSGYLEAVFGIDKLWGDIFGVAVFGVALGLGRTLYGKYGKSILRILFLGALGSTVCYLLAGLSNLPLVGLFACAFTGFCTSMLWPGSLLMMSDRFPAAGVAMYALMAAAGDFGISVGSQMVGSLTDAVIASDWAPSAATDLGMTVEQFGMKCGVLAAAIFPLVATLLYFLAYRSSNKTNV